MNYYGRVIANLVRQILCQGEEYVGALVERAGPQVGVPRVCEEKVK